MRCLVVILLILALAFPSNCQIIDNFSDGNFLSDPVWIDTAGTFIVNDELMLQLNAEEAGESFIYTLTSLEDSIRWKSYCLMDFSPSGSNFLRIYLAADNVIPEEGNSLYFEVGESGSNDALHLYENNNGISSLIASASMGALGLEPAEFSFALEKTADNIWSLFVDYGQSGTQLEWEMNMNIDWLDQSILYGYAMTYTSSRVDKFFFDDVVVEPLLPDMEAPLVNKVTLLSSSQVEIVFSEAMDFSQLQNLDSYVITPSLSNPTSVVVDSENTSLVILDYSGNEFQSGISYTLSISDLTDLAGNAVVSSTHSLQLVEPALPGDIFVNEILFNPNTGGQDFVEIYNASNKLIDLSSLEIANVQKDSYEPISTEGVFLPGSYLAICPDKDWLMENYPVLYPENIIENRIPSFNDSDGNVSVFGRQITGARMMVDSLDYDEEWHYILLDDEEGISLEKVSPTITSSLASSWHSAAETAGFATPGYENSQLIGQLDRTTVFNLQDKTFSPNQDGDTDRLVINYSLEKAGFLGTLRVYNDRGFLIKELYDNTLLSNEGILIWDGTKNDTQKASIGIYLISYELFHPDGDRYTGRLSCVLADFLK